MNKTVKIIAGFTIGAAAGSILGLLLAPGSDNACCSKAGDDKKDEADIKDGWFKKKRREKDLKEHAGVEEEEIL